MIDSKSHDAHQEEIVRVKRYFFEFCGSAPGLMGKIAEK